MLKSGISGLWRRRRREILYVASSASSSLLDYLVYISMTVVLEGYTIRQAYSLGKALGALLNFSLNNYLVFRKKGEKGLFLRALMYLALFLLMIAVGNLIIAPLDELLGASPLLPKLMTDAVTFVLGYLVQRFVVFKPKKTVENRRDKAI